MQSEAPKRLHPISLLFTLLTLARSTLVPLVFVWLASSGGWINIVILFSFFPAVIVALVKYFNYLYAFGEEQLVIRDGILTRNERHVRYKRIQNIDISQNVLHRMFGVAVVRLETASGGKPEAEISVLSLDAVEEMRRRVFAGRQRATAAEAPSDPSSADAGALVAAGREGAIADGAAPEAASEKQLLNLPLMELVRAGLISNRGFVVVAIAFGAAQQLGIFDNSGILERFEDRIVGWIESQDWGRAEEGLGSLKRSFEPEMILDHPFMLAGGILAAIVLFIAFVRLLSVTWTVVTLFGFTLKRYGDDLRTQYGLFTRVAATIPRHRIQLASVRRSLLHRLFKRAEVQIETAGGGDASQQGGGAVKLRVAPIVKPTQATELLKEMLPGIQTDVDWRPLSPKTFKRFMRRATVWTVILSIPVLVFAKLWGLLAIPLLLGYFIARARLYLAFTRYALTDDAILFKSGWWTQRMSIVRFGKIQAVEFVQSWFDKRYGMASVSLDTAGAGRVGHKIDIRYLEAAHAKGMMARLEDEAAQTDFRW